MNVEEIKHRTEILDKVNYHLEKASKYFKQLNEETTGEAIVFPDIGEMFIDLMKKSKRGKK